MEKTMSISMSISISMSMSLCLSLCLCLSLRIYIDEYTFPGHADICGFASVFTTVIDDAAILWGGL